MKNSTKNIIYPGTLKILVQFFVEVKCAVDIIVFFKSDFIQIVMIFVLALKHDFHSVYADVRVYMQLI